MDKPNLDTIFTSPTVRCKLCNIEIELKEKESHRIMHIINNDVWNISCRFGDGVCTNKRLYDECINDPRMQGNWMCWRDGILMEIK